MYSDIRIASPNALESRIGAIESRVDTLDGDNARDDAAGGGENARDDVADLALGGSARARTRAPGPIGHLNLAECMYIQYSDRDGCRRAECGGAGFLFLAWIVSHVCVM